MAGEQINAKEAIGQAVPKATRTAMQTIAVAGAERIQTRQTHDETTQIQLGSRRIK